MIVTVEEFKAHANISIDDDDELIVSKLAAAEEWIGKFIGTPLADFDPVPEPLKEATLQLTAYWYEQREAVLVGVEAAEVPFSITELVGPWREFVF